METVIVRTIFLYIVILMTCRLMGKREIRELSVIDFVVNLMIAELCVRAIEQPDAPMTRTLIPISILLLIQMTFMWFGFRNESFHHLVKGKPATLIKNGEVDEEQLEKQHFKFDELLKRLKEQNITSVRDVEFAYLETDGKLSVVKKEVQETASEPVWEIELHHLPLPLVIDGVIQKDHLQTIGKNQFWLRQQLRKVGYKDIKDIATCVLDDKGTFFVDEKNKWK